MKEVCLTYDRLLACYCSCLEGSVATDLLTRDVLGSDCRLLSALTNWLVKMSCNSELVATGMLGSALEYADFQLDLG